MTGAGERWDAGLPEFARPTGSGHPVLAEVLGELRAREAAGEPDFAYFRDSPDPPEPPPKPRDGGS
ncbi:hypothetical protein ABZX40_02605 [Streptomyces sp. NPDC004610]|uniref:hypothetical protein n=1 Tax=unclassified Streptomyces TaxID=2593676 RepID=UPI0033B18338